MYVYPEIKTWGEVGHKIGNDLAVVFVSVNDNHALLEARWTLEDKPSYLDG